MFSPAKKNTGNGGGYTRPIEPSPDRANRIVRIKIGRNLIEAEYRTETVYQKGDNDEGNDQRN